MITDIKVKLFGPGLNKSGKDISSFIPNDEFDTITVEAESEIYGDFELGSQQFNLSKAFIQSLGLTPQELLWKYSVKIYYSGYTLFWGTIALINNSYRFDSDYVELSCYSIGQTAGNWNIFPALSDDIPDDLKSKLSYDNVNEEYRFIREGSIDSVLNDMIDLANYSLDNSANLGYTSRPIGDYPGKFNFVPNKKELFSEEYENIRSYTRDLLFETEAYWEWTPILSLKSKVLERAAYLFYAYNFDLLFQGTKRYALGVSISENTYNIYEIINDELQFIEESKIKALNEETVPGPENAWQLLSGEYFLRQEIQDPDESLINYVASFANLEGAPESIKYYRLEETYYVIVRYTDINKIRIYTIKENPADIITVNYSASTLIKTLFKDIAQLTNRIIFFAPDGHIYYKKRTSEDNYMLLSQSTMKDVVAVNNEYSDTDYTFPDNIIMPDDAIANIAAEYNEYISGLRDTHTITLARKFSKLSSTGQILEASYHNPVDFILQPVAILNILNRSIIKSVQITEESVILQGEYLTNSVAD